MTTVVYATFDGEVLRPDEPVAIAPNTRVRLTIEAGPVAPVGPVSFLKTARSLDLDGLPDWSERIDELLYGEPDGDG